MSRRPGTIYLLHFDTPYKHARHYLGWTGRGELAARLAEHRAGRGARLLEVVAGAGIGWQLAATWCGDRNEERRLKNWHKSPQLCPICRAAQAAR